MILESPAFADGETIPRRHTCDGEDVSPPLIWREAPEGTRTFVLTVTDPDAPKGTWIHWLVLDLPASATALPEGASGSEGLPGGASEGLNSWGRRGWGGPCPPSGTHRYFFRLHALKEAVRLPAQVDASRLAGLLEGHVLAEATLMGRYARTPAR